MAIFWNLSRNNAQKPIWFFVTNTQFDTNDTKKTQFFCAKILLKIDKKLPLENLEKGLWGLNFVQGIQIRTETQRRQGHGVSALSLLPPCPRHGGRHAFEAIFPSFFALRAGWSGWGMLPSRSVVRLCLTVCLLGLSCGRVPAIAYQWPLAVIPGRNLPEPIPWFIQKGAPLDARRMPQNVSGGYSIVIIL